MPTLTALQGSYVPNFRAVKQMPSVKLTVTDRGGRLLHSEVYIDCNTLELEALSQERKVKLFKQFTTDDTPYVFITWKNKDARPDDDKKGGE